MKCPYCDKRMKSVRAVHTWTYGVGDDAVELSAALPQFHCECGGVVFGWKAEDIMEDVRKEWDGYLQRKKLKLRRPSSPTPQ